jgi:hypothetical protein
MTANASSPLRVVQWTTGNVARQAVRAVLSQPDLELVGAFAHTSAKVGRDVGELCGLDAPIGVTATDDIDALIALEPDCVVYSALFPDVEVFERLLERGINIVTSSAFLTGRNLGSQARSVIDAAAQRGNASIFGSGMNPGFAQLLAGVSAGVCVRVDHVRVVESVDVSLFAGDSNMDDLGWGRPAGDPGHANDVRDGTVVFAEAVDVLADLFGVTVDDHRCTVDFALASRDLDLPGRPIAAGHVAGLDVRWEGIVGDRAALELAQRWVMGSHIEPAWTVEHGYLIEVAGSPNIRTKFDIWPDGDLGGMTATDFHALGMSITALPVVNAIPAVCASPSGIRTYGDLPLIASRGRLSLK